MNDWLFGLGYYWLKSLRIRWVGKNTVPEKAVILLWHEHLPACIRAFSFRNIDVLISRSADGAWAARACERFGYRVHRGSSSRGSMGGMRALARGLSEGKAVASVGMALDGPRGPRHIPKPGSLWLARFSGLPVVPVSVRARRSFRLKTWDKCLIPLPFSKVEIHVGAPFHPTNLEEIQDAMAALQAPSHQARASG